MVKRTQKDAEETRESLIEAAKFLFETEGYAQTSLAAIADAAGVTKGALFHYFDSKEDLFIEVWTRLQVAMDKAAGRAAVKARDPSDPYAAFLAGCKVYFQWCTRADYQKVVLVDGPSVLGMKRWRELDFRLGQENMLRGAAYLARKGRFPVSETRPLAIMLQSALNGAGFALAAREKGLSRASLFRSFERMLRGLS